MYHAKINLKMIFFFFSIISVSSYFSSNLCLPPEQSKYIKHPKKERKEERNEGKKEKKRNKERNKEEWKKKKRNKDYEIKDRMKERAFTCNIAGGIRMFPWQHVWW